MMFKPIYGRTDRKNWRCYNGINIGNVTVDFRKESYGPCIDFRGVFAAHEVRQLY